MSQILEPKSCKRRVCRRPACSRQVQGGKGADRTPILQVLANAVPPPGGIKSALPQGKLFSKTAVFTAAFKSMRVTQAQHSYNSLILKA